ncbi:MAG: helix-hairpin-helix domain-containing protein [Gaiellaceae bacterium MAG52_C11]|nr:helix-hairpin-helix domain-containing protein [Candidatus Gaiellasilicea maunaloa]
MSAVCPILVDAFESKAVVAELRRQELPFEITHLAAGDYSLSGGILVERKEVRDLHLSVLEGRFWCQLGALRRVARRPFLLVEGPDLDGGALHPHAVRGAYLAAGALGIQVIRSTGVVDTVTWLGVLKEHALRPSRDRPVYAQRPRSLDSTPAEAVLAGVPGISVVLARRLLDRYGSVARLVTSDPETWEQVPGVGPSKAAALRRALF